MILRKENFALYVTCTREGYRVEGIPCKFYLPVKRDEPILLTLHPSNEQKRIIEYWWEFSIEGESKYESGEIHMRVYAGRVYWKNEEHQHIYWSHENIEDILACEPTDLKIIRYPASASQGEESHKLEGAFWITPSSLLSHAKILHPQDGGGFSVQTVHQQIFNLTDDLSLTYRDEYRSYRNDRDEKVWFSEPVLEYKLNSREDKAKIIDEELELLNDFLLLLSFISRHRTVWLGWEMANHHSHTTYFRKDIVLPDKKRRSYDDELISLANTEEFMNTVFREFASTEHIESLRRAINYTIPRRGEYVDSSFILLYAALETLVLDYRRKKSLEFIFTEKKQFDSLQSELRKWLKQQSAIEINSKTRGRIYEKLPELNRIAFSTAFNEFCNEYNVNVEDLWPVVGSPKEMPLSEIRNKIVHGDVMDYERRGLLHCARENLRWCVERMILSILRWPVEKSRASNQYLKNAKVTMYNWKQYRQAIIPSL